MTDRQANFNYAKCLNQTVCTATMQCQRMLTRQLNCNEMRVKVDHIARILQL